MGPPGAGTVGPRPRPPCDRPPRLMPPRPLGRYTESAGARVRRPVGGRHGLCSVPCGPGAREIMDTRARDARVARRRRGGSHGSCGAVYQIRIRGHLGAYGAAWFEGLTVVNLANGDALLTGRLVDQAALLGV